MEWIKDFAKDYIQEEKMEEFFENYKKEFPKHAMRKKEYNEVNEALKLTKEQLEETTKSIESLKGKATSLEEAEKKITDWEAQYKQLETDTNQKVGNITKRSNLKELLLTNNAHKDAIDLLVDKYLGVAELTEEGSIKDPSVLLEKIKGEKKGLFVETVVDSTDKDGNVTTATKTDDNERTRKLFGL